ncbi:MAG: DUF6261 family protein [Tannerellaceae bacterium]|nr:DUF6261 family protein [Tannerellaceae bacterium]
MKAAAEVIPEVMKNYGQAYYSPVTEASSLFINLIHDLGRENHVDKVSLIMGAEEAIAALNLHNEEFINLYSRRSLLAEEEKMDGNMQEARVRTDQMFEVLADSINVFYHANEVMPSGDAEVSDLLYDPIVFINSYLRQYKSILARRSASARSGDKPEPPE